MLSEFRRDRTDLLDQLMTHSLTALIAEGLISLEEMAIDGTKVQRTAKDFSFAPFDLPAAHIFKVGADGQMHEIEAMGFTTGYNSPTGWEK